MGEHKHNPTAIAASKGEIAPKPKQMSARQHDALVKAMLRKKLQDETGLPDLVRAMGGEYFYV